MLFLSTVSDKVSVQLWIVHHSLWHKYWTVRLSVSISHLTKHFWVDSVLNWTTRDLVWPPVIWCFTCCADVSSCLMVGSVVLHVLLMCHLKVLCMSTRFVIIFVVRLSFCMSSVCHLTVCTCWWGSYSALFLNQSNCTFHGIYQPVRLYLLKSSLGFLNT